MYSVKSECQKCGKKVITSYFPAKCPRCKAAVPMPTIWLDI